VLQRVEVESYAPALPLPIGTGAGDDPIQIRNIDGLGPVKAALSSTAYATGRGSYFQGGSIPERNIVLTLGLNPNWTDQTIASLRQLLYGYFMPEQPCKLRMFTDEYPDLEIEGICESVEPSIFAQDPEIQVSVINHQPDFLSIESTSFVGAVTNAITDGEPTEYEYDYAGSAPTGFQVTVKPSASLDYTGPLWFVLETSDTLESFKLTEAHVAPGHHLIFGTLDNDRKIVEFDTGDPDAATSILKQVESGSKWLKIMPGSNFFAVSAEENGLEFEVVYFDRYGGI